MMIAVEVIGAEGSAGSGLSCPEASTLVITGSELCCSETISSSNETLTLSITVYDFFRYIQYEVDVEE
ncbi:hypothetical protein L6452_02302 [Arctium lappa]|uniref:Uncharacterized protein n=1 Tax=Arctium lappa TaxID=4217 RepID=A0ACB9FIG2_ARCLA|nr:hypothetical protein L6452_02302 [Arctium lappa]